MKHLPFALVIVMATLFGCGPISPACGDTHTATTCGQSDVESAISAASDGDTVEIPAGTCAWSSTVTITDRELTIRGQSLTSPTITGKMVVSNDEGYTITLKDFKMIGAGYLLEINGGVKDFRVTNMTFIQSSSYATVIWGDTHGVIDNCTYGPSTSGASAIYIGNAGTTDAYAEDSVLGTDDQVVIEDCTITRSSHAGGTHAVWSDRGSSYTVRYCTIAGYELDVHGHCTTGGAREFEIYENDIEILSGASNKAWAVIRGGTGVIYDNRIENNGTQADNTIHVQIRTMEVDDDADDCDASTGGACHCCEYPCDYQLGRGKANALKPVYIWDNVVNESTEGDRTAIWPTGSCAECNTECDTTLDPADFMEEDRDYYLGTEKSGYTPLTYPHPLVGNPTPECFCSCGC